MIQQSVAVAGTYRNNEEEELELELELEGHKNASRSRSSETNSSYEEMLESHDRL